MGGLALGLALLGGLGCDNAPQGPAPGAPGDLTRVGGRRPASGPDAGREEAAPTAPVDDPTPRVPEDFSEVDLEALVAHMIAIPAELTPDLDPTLLEPGDPRDFPAAAAIGGEPVEIVREHHSVTGTLLRIATVRASAGLPQDDQGPHQVLHGPEWLYYPSGALRTRTWWRDDVKHGPIVRYRPVGTIDFEGRFEDGLLEGLRREYTKAGNLAGRALYRSGSLSGPYETWYPNGERSEAATYVDGELEGVRQRWSADGMLILAEHYRRGRREGRYTEFDPTTGQPVRWGDFVSGERHGIWSEASPGGKLTAVAQYRAGTRNGDFRLWDPTTHELIEASNFVDGVKSGRSRTWYASGEPQAEGRFERGARTGTWRYWRLDKTLNDSWSGTYENDVRVGPLGGESESTDAPPDHAPAAPSSAPPSESESSSTVSPRTSGERGG